MSKKQLLHRFALLCRVNEMLSSVPSCLYASHPKLQAPRLRLQQYNVEHFSVLVAHQLVRRGPATAGERSIGSPSSCALSPEYSRKLSQTIQARARRTFLVTSTWGVLHHPVNQAGSVK